MTLAVTSTTSDARGVLGANFRRLVTASAMSNLADGTYQICVPLVALTLTRDPTAFAAVSLVQRLPWLLFSLIAGALADRLDRRRTMTLVNLARALAIGVLALLVATDVIELWMLYVVGFALGVGETLFDTAAQSILPSIVESDQLDRANSRLQATELTANQFLGPPLGAFVAGATLGVALGLSAALCLLASVTLLTVAGNFRSARSGPATRIRTDIKEGVGYLFRHPLLRVLAICVGVSNLASAAVGAVIPLYLLEPGPVGLSERWFGVLLTTFAAGAVVGSWGVERLHAALGTRPTLLLATAAFPFFAFAPAVTTSAVLIGAIFFASGVLSIGWNIITVSFRQRIVPDHLLGRVNAGYRLVAWGTLPIGAGLGGLTVEAIGLRPAFAVFGAVSALCLAIVAFGTDAASFSNDAAQPANDFTTAR
jgi:MFS family permease